MKTRRVSEPKAKADVLTVIIRILIVLIVLAVAALAANIWWYNYERRTHPMEYSELVEHYSREFGVDKFLIHAVIKTESSYNPNAVSELGARGLMQIMPDTFEWIRDLRLRETGIGLTFDDMFVPVTNIRYGVYLISYHMGYYNNTDNSLAAYHAGDGAVDAWLKDKRYSQDGITLDVIPYNDTAHYVNKVNKAYDTYIRLYSNSY